MVKEELNQRSPLRKLEALTNGGVGSGNIGVIASKQGIGKTACLVHLAVDTLLRGKHVIHVSFDRKTDYISNWYENIFGEIAKKRELESAMDVHDEMIQNRIIMNFHQSYPVKKIVESLASMVASGQDGTDLIIIDGYDFDNGSNNELKLFKKFATENKIEVWFSDVCEESGLDTNGYPKNLVPYEEVLKTVLTLGFKGDALKLSLIKHDGIVEGSDLILDPKTLLIC